MVEGCKTMLNKLLTVFDWILIYTVWKAHVILLIVLCKKSVFIILRNKIENLIERISSIFLNANFLFIDRGKSSIK